MDRFHGDLEAVETPSLGQLHFLAKPLNLSRKSRQEKCNGTSRAVTKRNKNQTPPRVTKRHHTPHTTCHAAPRNVTKRRETSRHAAKRNNNKRQDTSRNVTPCHETKRQQTSRHVTKCLRRVTNRHETSRNVTTRYETRQYGIPRHETSHETSRYSRNATKRHKAAHQI